MDEKEILEALKEAMKPDPAMLSTNTLGQTVLKLAVPIKDDTGVVDALAFRRVTVSDLDAADGLSDQKKAKVLLSRLTGISLNAVGVMDAYDFNQANKVVGNFLTTAPKTGGSA